MWPLQSTHDITLGLEGVHFYSHRAQRCCSPSTASEDLQRVVAALNAVILIVRSESCVTHGVRDIGSVGVQWVVLGGWGLSTRRARTLSKHQALL